MLNKCETMIMGIDEFSGKNKKTGNEFTFNSIIFYDSTQPEKPQKMNCDMENGGAALYKLAAENPMTKCRIEYIDKTSFNRDKGYDITYRDVKKIELIK